MVGLITVFAMIMMIGNVLAKSRYGKTWAMVAGGSLLMAGLLLVVQMIAPDAEETASAEKGKQSAQPEAVQEKSPDQPAASAAAVPGTANANAAAAGDGGELAYLNAVLDNLKQGKPIPPEYLAMLPDGGKGILAMQANSGTQAAQSKLSEPLIQQIVAAARSQGKMVNTANSYVPTQSNTSAGTAQKPSGAVATAPQTSPNKSGQPGTAPKTPTGNNGSAGTAPKTPGSGTTTTPAPAPQPPVQQKPAPQPQPLPKPQPAAGSLLDGGVLKSVLSKSKADVKSFFQYNQSLGENGNTLTYLRGSTIVEVTLNGDTATSVYMRFDRLNPPNREQSYYETYMMGVAGMSPAEPSVRSGQDVKWNSTYSGASSIQFHIDTNTNSGYIRASR